MFWVLPCFLGIKREIVWKLISLPVLDGLEKGKISEHLKDWSNLVWKQKYVLEDLSILLILWAWVRYWHVLYWL